MSMVHETLRGWEGAIGLLNMVRCQHALHAFPAVLSKDILLKLIHRTSSIADMFLMESHSTDTPMIQIMETLYKSACLRFHKTQVCLLAKVMCYTGGQYHRLRQIVLYRVY